MKALNSFFNSISGVAFVSAIMFFVFFRKNKKSTLVNLPYANSQLSNQEAKLIANSCFEAMDGPGTDITLLDTTLYPLSDDSFNHVYKEFGIREGHDLIQWLISDLSFDEFKRYKDRFKSIK